MLDVLPLSSVFPLIAGPFCALRLAAMPDTRSVMQLRSAMCLLLIYLLSLLPLAAKEAAPVGAPYEKHFDPWHTCMAAEPLARKGAPDALRTLFLAAYVRVSQPFLGGEGDETMIKIFGDVLVALGDRKFARALEQQRPEVRSAVSWFLGSPGKKFPHTDKLLLDAPKIDWPLVKAYRDDR
jgi:hypothetical protein